MGAASMSVESNGNLAKDNLSQLRCHFTWELQIEEDEMHDLENRVFDQMEFLDTQCGVRMHNLLAYVKHLEGRDEEALGSLRDAEEAMPQEHGHGPDVKSLVTWGNFAWLCYHMGRLAETQSYLDKVEAICRKFSGQSSYRMESPEMDSEEGWALLKCGAKNYERAEACFEKALEAQPENPEFSAGYAIVIYRLDGINRTSLSLQPLQKALRLNPENVYVKVLLALKLQDLRQEAEAEKHIEEALSSTSSQTYVLRYAGKFYRRKGFLDKALHLFKMALQATPSSALLNHQIGLCYRAHVLRIKKAANWKPRALDREKVEKIARLAIRHLEFAVEQKPTFGIAHVHLAEMYTETGNYRKAEEAYHKVLNMTSLKEEDLQEVHFQYGRFQEFQRKSEVDAVVHYLKAIKIEMPSFSRNKSIQSLEKLALRKLQKNTSDVESLSFLGLICKLRGDLSEAVEHYERALRLAAGGETAEGHSSLELSQST